MINWRRFIEKRDEARAIKPNFTEIQIMARSNARNTRNASNAVAAFNVAAWRADLDAAALNFVSAGKAMLDLMLAARGKVEHDTAREALQHAFGQAYAATYAVPFEDALKSKSVMNRVSDGMAIFKAEKLPDSLPGQLQSAAAACRKANPSSKRKPRQPVAPKVEAKDVKALALLSAALEALRAEAGENEVALELIGELVDLAGDLADALANPEQEQAAA